MRIDEVRTLPARPPSEVEWEDLLLRIEVMPRALRVHLEGIDRAAEALLPILSGLVERELLVRDFLERAALAGDPEAAEPAAHLVWGHADAVDRFVHLRTRNFAMVQRRGLEVWEWEQDLGGTGSASVYQILTRLAAADVEVLAAVRALTRDAGRVC